MQARLLVSVHVLATAAISLLAIRLAGGGDAAIGLQAGAFMLAGIIASYRSWPALVERLPAPWPIGAGLLLAAGVLLFGVEIEGARRWLRIGPLVLQPAVLLGSFLLLALARADAGPPSAILAGLALLLVGIGNDGGTSLAFALGMTGLLAGSPAAWRRLLPLCLLACVMAAWGWTRPDALPSVAHVEEVVSRAAAVSVAAGLAASIALALLPLPFLLAARARSGRAGPLALAGFWGGLALAGVTANYPVPVIGYGASFVLGWVLALGALKPAAAPLNRNGDRTHA